MAVSKPHEPARPPVLPAAELRLSDSVREQLWFGDEDPARTALEASRSLAAALSSAMGLKPFPAVAQRAITLLSDPETPLRKVREALEKDPAITAGLLRIANSAAYRPRQPLSSVEEAVQRLGSRHVLEIVTCVAAMGLFKDAKGVGLPLRDHCSRVGALTRVLAAEWHQRTADSPFLCGLLHDLGKLLLIQVSSIDYRTLDPKALTQPDEAFVHERALLGYDHAVLGGHVLDAWKLPASVAEVVAWHHQPGRAYERGGEVGLGVSLVRLANLIDYQMRREPAVNEAFIAALAQDGAAQYAGYSEAVLCAMWPKLKQAADEMLSAIGS
ncbi:MAG: HDOD domain-containing protein [Myxococcales bacterium]|nr:MAG: HDOD domain-containing protein [Myxococcales bacterium]